MDYTLLLYLISRPNWFYLLPTYRYNWAQGYQEYCSEAPLWLPYLATVPLLSMIRPQPFSIYMVTTFFGCWSTNPRNPEWLYGSYSFKLTWIMTVSLDGSTGLPGTRTLKVRESRAGSTDSSGGLLGMIVIGGTPTFTAWFLDAYILPVGDGIYWSMGPILRCIISKLMPPPHF